MHCVGIRWIQSGDLSGRNAKITLRAATRADTLMSEQPLHRLEVFSAATFTEIVAGGAGLRSLLPLVARFSSGQDLCRLGPQSPLEAAAAGVAQCARPVWPRHLTVRVGLAPLAAPLASVTGSHVRGKADNVGTSLAARITQKHSCLFYSTGFGTAAEAAVARST